MAVEIRIIQPCHIHNARRIEEHDDFIKSIAEHLKVLPFHSGQPPASLLVNVVPVFTRITSDNVNGFCGMAGSLCRHFSGNWHILLAERLRSPRTAAVVKGIVLEPFPVGSGKLFVHRRHILFARKRNKFIRYICNIGDMDRTARTSAASVIIKLHTAKDGNRISGTQRKAFFFVPQKDNAFLRTLTHSFRKCHIIAPRKN